MTVIRFRWWWHSAWPYRCAAVQEKRGPGHARSPASSPISTMTQPETPAATPCVPVSTSVAQCPGRALCADGRDTRCSDNGPAEDGPNVRQNRGPCQALRARVDLALWELEAVAAVLAAECGPAEGQARLIEARWTAARALLLELCAAAGPDPAAPGGPELRMAPETEGALLGLLVRNYGWSWVDQSCLRRQKPPTRPAEAAVPVSVRGGPQPPTAGTAGAGRPSAGGGRRA
jgi:hypothetical protein